MSEFSWPVRVYYEDTDSGGVVYYANYLKFLERARTEWLRAHGFEQSALVHDHGLVFVVRDVHISYLRPAVFDDLLGVTVDVHGIGRSWIEFAQTVRRGEEILSRAQVKIVCVNHSSFKPVEIPGIIRKKMENRT
jgi:acyl-CoA thioester hydrolase